MLRGKYLNENDLKDYGFKSLGKNVLISSDARVYGPENIKIGNNVRIDDFVTLSGVNGSIEMGNFIFIARGCHISGAEGVTLGDFSSMAANTILYSASDDYTGGYLTAQVVPQKYTKRVGGPINIGRHVIIGSASTILGPCCIGEGVSIGAMSLVNKDLDSWGIYLGVPVRLLRVRTKKLLELEKKLLQEI